MIHHDRVTQIMDAAQEATQARFRAREAQLRAMTSAELRAEKRRLLAVLKDRGIDGMAVLRS